MMNISKIRLVVAGLVPICGSAALAGEPLLGVSGIEIPGRFLELSDANGDGIEDVIFVGPLADQLGYMPGGEGFDFGEPVTFTGANLPDRFGYTIGVIDDTGLPTALVLRGSDLQGYRIANGQTTLGFTERFIPGQAASGFRLPRAMLSGDLDGDGLTDLLIHRDDGFVIRWSSRQVFTRYQQFETSGPIVMLPILDYDGDGLADVMVILEDSRELVFYPGGGIDKLGSPVSTGVILPFDIDESAFEHLSRGMGNLDGAGGMDLVYFTNAGSAVLVLNFATPDSRTIVTHAIAGSTGGGVPVVLDDLDGSGLDEVAFPQFGILTSSGMPWIRPGRIWFDLVHGADQFVDGWFHSSVSSLSNQSGFISALVKAIDINADGRKEIVTFSDDISVLHDRAMTGPASYGPDSARTSSFILHTLSVDLNGDGLPELLNSGGTPMILNPRDIGAPPIEIAGYSGGFMSIPVALADDGVVRVAVSGATLRIVSFGPDGLPVSVETYASPSGQSFLGLCVGDFDGDGLEDIAATSAGTVQIFRSLGDGTVEWFAEVAAPGVVKPAAADLDGDGLADLVVGDTSADRVTVLANRGGGVFEAVQSWETPANYWLDIEDLDGDGLLDIAGVNGNTSGFAENTLPSAIVWYGQPGGGFGDELVVRSRGNQIEIVAVDLDGDGLKDFVFADDGGLFGSGGPPSDLTVVYRQTAPRVYEYAGRLPGYNTTGAIAGDFNGDGAMDIATVNGDARRTFVHWGAPPACPADLNQNGQVDFGDLIVFLQRFNDRDPAADLAPAFGSWDFFDVLGFLSLYSAGCP